MGVAKLFLLVAVAIAVLGYYIKPSFPDSASNHRLKNFVGISVRLIEGMANIAGFLGVAHPLNVTRYFLGLQVKFYTPFPGVEETMTTMDGIEVVIFRPRTPAEGLRAGIVHYHGGGWTTMSPEIYAPVYREIVEQTQCVLVAVRYRLAPEHPFPAAINDCLQATRYFLKNAEKYGVDKDRIGLKGDSAGGNLVMAAAIQLLKEKGGSLPALRFLSLDYPFLQTIDFNLPSYITHGDGPGFARKHITVYHSLMYGLGNIDLFDEFYVNNHTSAAFKASDISKYVSPSFLPKKFQKAANGAAMYTSGNEELFNKIKHIYLNPLFMPLMASDDELKGLPPTYIMNCEFDVLRDDGFIAAQRLRNVGVDVEHTYYKSEEHGLLNFVEFDKAAKMEVKNFAKIFKKIVG